MADEDTQPTKEQIWEAMKSLRRTMNNLAGAAANQPMGGYISPALRFLVNFVIELQEAEIAAGGEVFEIPPIPLGRGAFIHIYSLRDLLKEDAAEEDDILKRA